MNLQRLIHSGVRTAKRLTQSTLVDVQHFPATGRSAYGATFGAPVTRQALWQDEEKVIRIGDGQERLAIGKLTFLDPVQVTPEDRFRTPTLPPDVTVPVLRHGALMDPDSQPYLMEVWLGAEATRS